MKKFLISMALAIPAFAGSFTQLGPTPVQWPPPGAFVTVPPPPVVPVTNPNDGIAAPGIVPTLQTCGIGMSVSANLNCELGDKIFSDFAGTGYVSITQGSGQIYQVIFTPTPGGSWTGPTNWAFNVAVDPLVCSTCTIVQIQDQMFTSRNPPTGFTPNDSTLLAIHSPGGNVNLNALSGAGETGQTGFFSATSVYTTAMYLPGTLNPGQASTYEVDIIQSTTPEPATFAIGGLGLIAIGLLKRRRA